MYHLQLREVGHHCAGTIEHAMRTTSEAVFSYSKKDSVDPGAKSR